MFHVKHHIKIRQSWLQTTSRRQPKSFSVQQFFKNAAEVWASSPHLRSKSKLHHEIKQTSKKQSEESQLLLKLEGCKYGKRFQGQLRFPGKLGMCPCLAEPDWGGFPKRIVFSYKPQANKSFSVQQFFKNAAEVWASSPHLRSKSNFAICFSCCNCTFETFQFAI